MAGNEGKVKKSKIIHTIIGICIMIFFQFLPVNLPSVTDVGMQILGIFLGTLYLWTTVDILWSSLLCLGAIGISAYTTMDTMLESMLGNSTLMLMLFIMILSGALVKFKLTDYIARFFLTRKITKGRPWMFTFVICLACFLMAAFVNAFAPVFLFWAVLGGIFKQVGYTTKDKMPKIMMMLVIVSSLIGFPVPSYMGNGLILLSNFRTVSENLMGEVIVASDAAYLITGILLGLVLCAVVVLACKFILRPDVSLLKNYEYTETEENKLPPLDIQQKVIGIGFVILIIFMLVPSIIPADIGFFNTLSGWSNGLPLLATAILAAIPYKEKSILDVQNILATNFSFDTLFLCAAAIYLGSALTNEATGISGLLTTIFSPIFGSMSFIVFTITIVVICCILTNFCNSLVIAMIFETIIANVCATTGFDPKPIITIMILFTMTCALFTPAASPWAAILHGNRTWFSKQELYKYTAFFVAVELVVALCVGIPLSNLMNSIL